MEPERVLRGTKKGYPIGTAEEPFLVLDSTFFSTLCRFMYVRNCGSGDYLRLSTI